MKNPWVIIGLITVLLFGGAVWYSSSAAQKNNEGVSVVPVQVKGNPDASVTLVEYSDLQCPACASFAPVVAEVMTQYGDRVRFEYKHFPLPIHPFAQQAAVAAEAAGQQGKFFEFHDALFANQDSWSKAAAPQTFFIQYATDLGLDIDTFRRHMNSSLLRDKVRSDLGEARDLGLTGTPSFFLNGERMEFQTFQEFVEQIAFAVDPSAQPATEGSAPAQSEVIFGL